MSTQKFRYDYKDAQLQVTVDAQNTEDEWANNADLMEAMQKVIRCATNWKHFEFHVVAKGYEE
jgi:hypothetical protein